MSEVATKFFMPMKVAFMEKKGPREEMGKVVEQISQLLKEKKTNTRSCAQISLTHNCLPSILTIPKSEFLSIKSEFLSIKSEFLSISLLR